MFYKLLLFLSIFHFSLTTWALNLKINNPSKCYIRPDQETTIVLGIDNSEINEIDYNIEDYSGSIVSSAKAVISNNCIKLKLKLPSGYYTCRFPGEGALFGIYVSNLFTEPKDTFFGIDAAFSWLVAGGKKHLREDLIKVLNQVGVASVRERIMWNDINKAKGKYSFTASRTEYKQLRECYKKYGLDVLDVFHDSPKWLKKDPSPYPSNLLETSSSWSIIADSFNRYWCGLEIWNEPDIGFGKNLPAEHYMPLVKAISHTIRNKRISTPLVGGAFTDRCPDSFRDVCAESGLLECVDAISLHHYGKWDSISQYITSYRNWLTKHGHKNMPIWISETGQWRKKTTNEREANNYRTNVAKSITLKTVESKAMGVAKFFPFIYGNYSEGSTTFSMLDKNYTPLKPCAAYFTSIQFLANKTYVGDIKLIENTIGRVFKGVSNECTVVFSPVSNKNIKTPFSDEKCWGIDGRQIKVDQGIINDSSEGVFYQRVNWEKVEDKLVLNKDVENYRAVEKQQEEMESSPIILSPGTLKTENPFFQDVEGYSITPEGRPLKYYFSAQNISQKTVKISLDASENTFIKNSSLETTNIDILPGQVLDLKLKFELKNNLESYKNYFLKISGSTNRGTILPLVTSINISQSGITKIDEESSYRPQFLEANNWKMNKSSNTSVHIIKSPTQTLLLNANIDGDGWFFPELKLKKALWKDCTIIVKLKTKADKAHTRLMLTYDDGTIFMTRSLLSTSDKWRKLSLTQNDFHYYSHNKDSKKKTELELSKVTRIKLGANTRGDKQVDIELADLIILKND